MPADNIIRSLYFIVIVHQHSNMKRIFLFFVSGIFMLQLKAQDSVNLPGKPFVLGSIREIDSKILSEKRTVNIYLPAGYKQNDTTKYPVIYLLDGSADEDFIHVAGLVQYLNFPWVNILPSSILVGIANVDRKRDFTFPTSIKKDKADFPTTGGSANFISFIEKELQPFINRNYNTTGDKTLIGQSFGGLLATEILFAKPWLFTNYIIISPSLWWENESLLAKQPACLKPDFNAAIKIFIGVGKEGKIMEAATKRLVSILNKPPKKNIRVHFHFFAHEDHASILHNALYKAFDVLNKKPGKKLVK